MAVIKPFAALRPQPDLAARICALPYDVMSADEARRLAAGNPLSFLHVSRPEIDLPPGTDPYAPEVYARGRAAFAALQQQGALCQDPTPGYYLYRQVMGRHAQTGIVGAAGCDDYERGVIRKHELTRVDKEDDRVRHIETLGAQTGPAFLVYRAVPALDRFVAERCAAAPAVDFVADDGVRHTAWVVADPDGVALIEAEFSRLTALYIADGHHRTAAAARVHRLREGRGGSGLFLAVIFPHDQVQLLAYHRLVRDLGGRTAAALLGAMEQLGEVRPAPNPTPERCHEVGIYLEGRWWRLTFKPELFEGAQALDRLDVALLQRHVLGPLFQIDDPRRSDRIDFVGGIRGTVELERCVNGGDFACAFALYPTGIQELMAIADAGEIMPPKSTWFEPKLRDAMFCHLL